MTKKLAVAPALRTLQGAASSAYYELDRERTILGKHPDCDIVLDQSTVSKRHARIERRADGYYWGFAKSRSSLIK